MKKKILNILMITLIILNIVGCTKKKESEDPKVEQKQEITILEEKDGEIIKGTLEGYTFTETEDKTDRVKIQMENGDTILIVLSNKDTPITIANFKELVSEKFYDGLIFHRVIKDFMIQGGDPEGTGMGGSAKTIKGEFSLNGVTNSLSHTKGVISMARSSEYNSASSQFFICHADATYLDGSYAAFGKVFAGFDIVDKIANVETSQMPATQDRPLVEQKIKSIRFITVEKA